MIKRTKGKRKKRKKEGKKEKKKKEKEKHSIGTYRKFETTSKDQILEL